MSDSFEKAFGFIFWGLVILYFFGAFDSDPKSEPKSLVPVAQTYKVVPAPTTPPVQRQYNVVPTPTFNGYDCTVDCSGHEAGYDWAEENGITDPSDCGGNSNSFIEGCESYAQEQGYEEEEYYEDYEYNPY